MTKFSERAKYKKTNSKPKKAGINYALGCLILVILIPVLTFGYISVRGSQQDQARRERVKTRFYEGLTATLDQTWAIKGYEIEGKEGDFEFIVNIEDEEIPLEDLKVQYRVVESEEFLGELEPTEDNPAQFRKTIDADELQAGEIELEAVAESPSVRGKKWTSNAQLINISYPLYIAWTMDWEGMSVTQTELNQMEAIRKAHRDMPITHFFNPRVWLPSIGSYQANLQLNYVKQGKQKYGDEISLHLHMWTDVVRASGVTPRTSPAWDNKNNVTAKGGYDVPSSAYPYEEFKKILEWSLKKFEENGLEKPVSFRAGGWYADLENIKAMESVGIRIDSSGRDARNWWGGYFATEWSLGSTSQPYKVSKESLNSDQPEPTYDVWEFPNNGSDSYWYTTEHLLTAFEDNFRDQKPLTERKILNYLSHPHWFNVDKPKLTTLFNTTDQYYHSTARGPVYYITLEDYLEIIENDPERLENQT